MYLIAQSLTPVVCVSLTVLTIIGLLAFVSPLHFSKLARRGGAWFDSQKVLNVLDKRIDIDETVLPYSRVLGFAVLASVVLIASLLFRG